LPLFTKKKGQAKRKEWGDVTGGVGIILLLVRKKHSGAKKITKANPIRKTVSTQGKN